MNNEDVARMALDAGIRYASVMDVADPRNVYFHELFRFAALVAEHECEHGMKLLADVLIDAAVKAEREGCAKACESLKPAMRSYDHRFWDACHESAEVIRARGQA